MQFVEAYLFRGAYLLAAFLCLYFLTKGKRQCQDWLAAALVLALLAPVIQRDLVEAIRPDPGNYFLLRETIPLLISPLVFLYTLALIHPSATWRRRDLVHLVPFIAATGFLLSPILPATLAFRMPGPSPEAGPPDPARYMVLLALSLSGAASFGWYGSRILALLRTRRGSLERYLSFMTAELRLFWIKELLVGLAAVQVYLLAATAAAALGLRHPLLNPSLALNIGYSLFLAFFGYFALRQDRIVFRYGNPSEERVETSAKYRKSSLEGDRAARILAKLETLMAEEELFRQGDLTLEDLSRRTGIPRHYISQALNEGRGRNFYAWVNEYRAKDLARALEDSALDHRTVLDLALASGFNSKSSFTAYFKALTGRTPTEHRRIEKEVRGGSPRSG